MDRSFARLKKEGVVLPDGAQGYIIFRHASMTEARAACLDAGGGQVHQGCHGEESEAPGQGSLGEGGQISEPEGWDDAGENEEDDDDYIYVAESNLNMVMEKGAVMEALASYREEQQALKDQRNGRGFYPGKGYMARAMLGRRATASKRYT